MASASISCSRWSGQWVASSERLIKRVICCRLRACRSGCRCRLHRAVRGQQATAVLPCLMATGPPGAVVRKASIGDLG